MSSPPDHLGSVQLPLLFATFLGVVVAFPLLRQRLRTGQWAVVVRGSAGTIERFVRGWLAALSLGLCAWSWLVPALGAGAMGIWSAPAWVAPLGVALIALGALTVVVAQWQMGASWRIGIDGRPTALVTGGLYRRVRHPIYTGILTALLGLVCVAPSALTVGAGLLMYILIAVQCRLEDEHMLQSHGRPYLRWAGRTGRLLPGIGRLCVAEGPTP